MSLHKMIENIDSMTVGLDDTFKFHCDQCGKCCTHREDIILSPMDVFRLSRELNITPVEFYKEWTMIGNTSSRTASTRPSLSMESARWSRPSWRSPA